MGNGGVGFAKCLECGAHRISLTQALTKDGIDKAGSPTNIATVSQCNGFVDSSMAGNAIQPEDLVEPQPEQYLHK